MDVEKKQANILTIVYINIRSLRNKIDDILEYIKVSGKEIHIIALPETWMYENETQYIHLPGYNAIHDCRKTRGGGCSMFIKNRISFSQKEFEFSDENCNIITAHLEKQNATIHCIYRAPKCNSTLFLSDLNKIIENENNQTIIIGDMNFLKTQK